MYQASNAFHQAVRNGEPQKPLLVFSNAVFSDMDIDVEAGIEFDDYFNTEEDLVVGQALSNEIRFTMFNDDRHLNNFGFGEFKAMLGVRVSSATAANSGNVTLTTGRATYVGRSTSPYLTRNGTAVGVNFPVYGLFYFKNTVYVYGRGTDAAAVSDTTGSIGSMPESMKGKNAGIEGQGYYYEGSLMMQHFHDGMKDTYEFVPLGVFIAERPKSPDRILIDMVCHDRMQKFDGDMPALVYPISAGELLTRLCNAAGVPNGMASFSNMEATVNKEMQCFKSSTMRMGIGWIAELAGANARIDRNGYLILDWIRSTNQHLDEHDYTEFHPYWYTTERVGNVVLRSSDNGLDVAYGAGGAGYLVQDNPFLRKISAMESLKQATIRVERFERRDKEARKIAMCMTDEGEIDYDKLLYLSDDEAYWEQESADWDAAHPKE